MMVTVKKRGTTKTQVLIQETKEEKQKKISEKDTCKGTYVCVKWYSLLSNNIVELVSFCNKKCFH